MKPTVSRNVRTMKVLAIMQVVVWEQVAACIRMAMGLLHSCLVGAASRSSIGKALELIIRVLILRSIPWLVGILNGVTLVVIRCVGLLECNWTFIAMLAGRLPVMAIGTSLSLLGKANAFAAVISIRLARPVNRLEIACISVPLAARLVCYVVEARCTMVRLQFSFVGLPRTDRNW